MGLVNFRVEKTSLHRYCNIPYALISMYYLLAIFTTFSGSRGKSIENKWRDFITPLSLISHHKFALAEKSVSVRRCLVCKPELTE